MAFGNITERDLRTTAKKEAVRRKLVDFRSKVDQAKRKDNNTRFTDEVHLLAVACAACGFANDPTDQFCGGAPLRPPPSKAPSKFASPDAYTPRHLAEKILTSKATLEGARKQVTVLFVDASGFTAISERLDPEDIHGFMRRAFELMLAEVHRYEGTVNQFLGDGIMGQIHAQPDHPDFEAAEQACPLILTDAPNARLRPRWGRTDLAIV